MLLGYPAEALVWEYAIWLLDEAGIVHGSLYSRWSEIGRWRSRLRCMYARLPVASNGGLNIHH
jgi:hypothetical protein